MRKIFVVLAFSFLAFGLSTRKGYAVQAPLDAEGHSLSSLDFIGAIPCNIDAATGTATVICNSSGTNGISLGRAIVYGVMTSSISSTDFLVLKDTTGIGNVAGYLAPISTLTTNASTAAVVLNSFQYQTSTSGQSQPLTGPENFLKFPVPIQFTYGISANVSNAPTSNNGQSRWTILYRNLDSSQK